MKINKYLTVLFVSISLSQPETQYIDGVAAVVENHIVLKSDLAQMVNMTAIQQKLDPRVSPDVFLKLQNTILQSMIDQKILLEMAKLDSIDVSEKDVDLALEQQVQLLISQAGNKKNAEEMLGQSIKDFQREFWYDMKDRMVSERYQQQLINSISVSRDDVLAFYETYKDSLPRMPFRAKVRHVLIPILPSKNSKDETRATLNEIKHKIEGGESFEGLAKIYSLDTGSKNSGGSLGWVTRGSLVKNFEAVAFTIDIGDVSDPVETEFGYHILETLEKQGEKIRVRHILMSPVVVQEDIERAHVLASSYKDSILSLDDFKYYAKEFSSDKQTSDIGGDLGWLDPANYPIPEIGQALKHIGLGVCSPPINSSMGFHLLWVEGVKRSGKPTLEEHWVDIENYALNRKQMTWYQSWIEKTRKKIHIHIANQ